MNKAQAIANWVVANKSWIYPAAASVGGWLVRHLWPAKACPTCASACAAQKADAQTADAQKTEGPQL